MKYFWALALLLFWAGAAGAQDGPPSETRAGGALALKGKEFKLIEAVTTKSRADLEKKLPYTVLSWRIYGIEKAGQISLELIIKPAHLEREVLEEIAAEAIQALINALMDRDFDPAEERVAITCDVRMPGVGAGQINREDLLLVGRSAYDPETDQIVIILDP